jgi:hypothetical protein
LHKINASKIVSDALKKAVEFFEKPHNLKDPINSLNPELLELYTGIKLNVK